ncbi:MAG: response regulator [Acidobacteriaceae bacterium]
MQKSVLLIDDDLMSRELIGMLLEAEGFFIASVESGEAALETLQRAAAQPQIVLTDMHMPGITGKALAEALRKLCSEQLILLGMSATSPAADILAAFDGFLLKPFNGEQFSAAVRDAAGYAGSEIQTTPSERISEKDALDEVIYARLATAMPQAQLKELYAVCLQDVRSRIDRMKAFAAASPADDFRREAHAVKGSCAILGATRLKQLAGAMEAASSPLDHADASLRELLVECERLESILNTQFHKTD